jgi:3-oxoacyl-[acyl-carrier protein] reductase
VDFSGEKAMQRASISAELTGKVALVTGASSGIGAAVAGTLAANGAMVWVNHPGEATLETAEAVVAGIVEAGGTAQAIQADVSSESDVLAMFSAMESKPLDILVNNAGIAHSSPIEALEVDDFDRLMGVHLRGTFLCTRSALKKMYAQNSGRIINTASQLAYIGAPGLLPLYRLRRARFCLSRAASLWRLGTDPSPPTASRPGATMTPILEDVPADILEGIRQNIPAGRIADVEDIVGAYLFLASDAAGHFRGQCLSPNGGDAFSKTAPVRAGFTVASCDMLRGTTVFLLKLIIKLDCNRWQKS